MFEDYTFEQEIAIYKENVGEWIDSHFLKFVLIKNSELVGFFDTSAEACNEGYRRFGRVPFMVRRVGASEIKLLHRNEIIYGSHSVVSGTR